VPRGRGEVCSSGVRAVPVRQNVARVVEEDDAVAEQAPTLFRVAGKHPRGAAIDAESARAARLVGALIASDRLRGWARYRICCVSARYFSTHVASLPWSTDSVWVLNYSVIPHTLI
jgi:hypothetical protein